MNRHTIFAKLRDALAELYSQNADIRLVAHDVGLDCTRIAFDGSAQTIWHNVMDETHNKNQLDDLLEYVHSQYPNNLTLCTAIADYQEWLDQYRHHDATPQSTDVFDRSQRPRPLPQLVPNFVGRDEYLKLFEEKLTVVETGFQVFIRQATE